MNAIKRVLIVGAGTMGHSLALLFAKGGFEVRLVDKEPKALERALKLIESASHTLMKAGLLTKDDIQKVFHQIQPLNDLRMASVDSDIAIESVDEDPTIKKEIFHLLDRYCPQYTILTSNTSALNIFDIIDTRRPEKVVITHFFSPPHIIPLVEVVPGEKTHKSTIEMVMQLLESLGKEPLLLKEYIPGFIVNRIQRAIAREAFALVDRGCASVEEIDKAIKASLGVRLPVVGILQTYDFTGLDAYYRITKATPIQLAPSSGPPKIVREKVEKGELGIKTGKGLYDYSDRSREGVLEKRDLNYLKILSALESSETL